MLRDKRANSYLDLDPEEYYNDRMMANGAAIPSVVGQFSAVDLFNDGNLGLQIQLSSFALTGPANSIFSIYPVSGHLSTKSTGSVAMNPLQQQREGAVFYGSLISFPTAAFFAFVSSNGIYQWPYAYPLVTIPAGYSVRITMQTAATSFNYSFLWMIEPES